MAKKNFYAVKNGRVPGIYKTWVDCQAQIEGYPRAAYKGFALLDEAREYLAGTDISLEVVGTTASSYITHDISSDANFPGAAAVSIGSATDGNDAGANSAAVSKFSLHQQGKSKAPTAPKQKDRGTYAEMMEVKARPEDIVIPMPDIEIYVDGSYFDGSYSWGFAVYSGGQLIHTAYGVGKSADAAKLHNVAGEMSGAMAAASWAKQLGLDAQGITIIHDYKGVAEWAMGRWKTNNPITAAYAAYMKNKRSWIRFQKVAGHTGVKGNELADRLAKRALEELAK